MGRSTTSVKLERVNELLQDPELNLPPHRRSIDPSGHNLVWLKNNIEKFNKITPELRSLLDLPIQSIMQD